MAVNKNIKRLRLANNLTQQIIAEKLNISQNAYSLIENGKTKIDVQRIRQFASIFNVDSAELLNDVPLNFQNINQQAQVTSKHESSEDILHLLKEQLKVKDKQIEQLILQLEQVRYTGNLFQHGKINTKS
ncbi:helix-turn-helix domain-containing protein [Pedobacter borealis]|uniref:helix-turn-helix domain-containing protein n=1 Tax=Pedobacter borealis TaxID=475254 RepID=UPI00068D42E9|nr:helix-turn-helix transcriptional regulator [Pedobacter borealis]